MHYHQKLDESAEVLWLRLRINLLLLLSTTWGDIMKKLHKFTKNFYLKAENMKQSMSILHFATIKCNTLMFPLKSCQGMRHLILKASSQPISKLATIIKYILVKMLKKHSDLFSRNLKVEIYSNKTIC